MSRPTDRIDRSTAALWFALLGGPVAWSAHLLASYPLVPVSCRMGTTAPLNALTVVMALVAAAAAVTGGITYRAARATDGVGVSEAGVFGSRASEARTAFMGLCGLLLGLLFTFVILMEGLPPVLQNPCAEGL